MTVDWNKGTIDFKSSAKQAGFTYKRMIVGVILLPAGIIMGLSGLIPVVHEIGHAVAGLFVGQGITVHWDHVGYVSGLRFGVKDTIISLGGPFGGMFLWTGIALLMTRKFPGWSVFPMAYTIGETIWLATAEYSATGDLYKMPVAQVLLLLFLPICVIVYIRRLTGGGFINLTKGN